jgi:hypothetical protein
MSLETSILDKLTNSLYEKVKALTMADITIPIAIGLLLGIPLYHPDPDTFY